jgi:hypothetical protein
MRGLASPKDADRDLWRQNLPVEFRLALAAARWPLKERDRIEISQLASNQLNWKWFTRIVERNQILPLVYHNLRSALTDPLHAEILRSLRDAALADTGHSMAQAAELVRITNSIRSAGLEIVALKGVALSVLAYGNLSIRSTGDIDLLAPATQVSDIERVLIGLGYTRFEPGAELTPKRLKHYLRYYKHFVYFSEKGAPLELHWRLYHNPLLKKAGFEFPPTAPVTIGSGVVSTISKNEMFLYLSAHGANHGWPILKWLADIGALLSLMTAEDLRRVAELASERGLTGELRAALLLVELLLAVEAPAVDLGSDGNLVAERVVKMSLKLLSAENYCLDIQRLPRLGMFLYDLRLRSSWRYRSEEIRRSLLFPDDWELIDLPDALFSLYAVIRPVSWLVRHFPRLSRRQPTLDRP